MATLVAVPRKGTVEEATELEVSGGSQASGAIKTEAWQTVIKIDQGS